MTFNFIKYASVFLLTTLLIFTSMTFQPKPAQAFHDTCTSAKYDNGRLEAFCGTRNGSMRASIIRLTNLIANIDGDLVWKLNGGFDKTCINMLVDTTDDERLLYADCARNDDRGRYVRDYIRLDTRIVNIDGYLKYVAPESRT